MSPRSMVDGRRSMAETEHRIDLAIKAGRALRKMTQEELAARIGIPRTEIARWETRRRTPCVRNVVGIARALEISPRLFIEAAMVDLTAVDHRPSTVDSGGDAA